MCVEGGGGLGARTGAGHSAGATDEAGEGAAGRHAAHDVDLDVLGADAAALRVVELEPLGREGKRLRASIAMATGRTSMPAIFVGGRAVGGFTDGDPVGDDADLCLEGSPGLEALADSGKLRELLAEAGVESGDPSP